ncbi:hypothetical protein F2P81_020541 [Scophthalmus maximus]|uniref:Uncharacterized protein n=1 Tax=Scophthalmus maximus TaxID=52904 RepID=A0A6A4S8B0_SCOMX|nr:hypothetical protein F2P81_020541 [Scophthalmus maximus]
MGTGSRLFVRNQQNALCVSRRAQGDGDGSDAIRSPVPRRADGILTVTSEPSCFNARSARSNPNSEYDLNKKHISINTSHYKL